MSNELPTQSLSFVWHPQHFNSSVLELARQTDTTVILDISGLSSSQLSQDTQILKGVELKLSLEQFFSSSTKELLEAAQTQAIWVEFFQELSSHPVDVFLKQVSEYKHLNCNVISGDLQFIHSCLKSNHDLSSLAVKGSESSGFVSCETTLTLLSHLELYSQAHTSSLPIHVWGGIATPEGAAACLASGVSQIIFESVHCLTDKVLGRNNSRSKKISQLRIDHMSLVNCGPGTCFRAFDKGNSQAVKKVRKLLIDRQQDATTSQLHDYIATEHTSFLQADFDSKQLIPLGPEAAFADSFADKFGLETSTALAHFKAETEQLYSGSDEALPKMLQGAVTKALRTQYPFIQGAMSCISDIPDFALSIAKAGGLPTIALGNKSISEIEKEFSSLQETLAGYTYAINVITLPENPHRQDQLSWLEQTRPPFVVIAAGDPAHAAKLQKAGIEVIFVTSDIDLVQLAWKNNIRFVVCEGHEAGGHVGSHSTLTLAQAILEIKHQQSTGDSDSFLILAGGIYNTNSLARAAILGADGVQMGTLYLSSQEIVTSGALSDLYQQSIIKSSFGQTMLTGESVGLHVRSLCSPKIEKIHEIEEQIRHKTSDESVARQQLEKTSIGSLLMAARGLHPQSGEKLSTDVCYREGQFMSGVGAGDIQKVLSVEEIHHRLAQQEFAAVLPRSSKQKTHRVQLDYQPKRERIAITGMSVVNALGNSPEEIWQACLAMKSGITEVPPEKWDHNEIYKPGISQSGKTYCRVAAFLSLDVVRQELGIPPHDFRTMSESTKLTLWLAHKAVHDSAILTSDIARHRIGVLISQNAGEIGSTMKDLTIVGEAENISNSIRQSFELTPKQDQPLEQVLTSDLITFDDTTLLGRLNSSAGGFICNKYGFMGPSYAVTSACASSLTALYSATQMIRNGVLDAAILGGGEELIIQMSFFEFSMLGALAGKEYDNKNPGAFSRPFDAERSGMVLGEGGGMIVIERESVAKKRGANILAYISGVGASNNHLGMVESNAETQKIAINSSFEDAGYLPDQVDLVECHATATQLGDKEEVEALKEIYNNNNSLVLSSFKSQIGHTLGASGINSLVRGICAMRDGTYPPTLNYDTPDPSIRLEENGFRVCTKPEKWPRYDHRPRRLQVNAFGFGGANYVVQVEEADWCTNRTNDLDTISGLHLTDFTLNGNVSFFKTSVNGKNFRIGSVNTDLTKSEIDHKLQPYFKQSEPLSREQHGNLKKLGLFVGDRTSSEPMALVFTGQGTHYPRMGKELYENFETIRHWMDTVAQHAEFDILELLLHKKGDNLRRTIWQQPALFILEFAIYQQFKSLGIKPAALAGHSTGELSALCAAGCFSYQDAIKITNMRAKLMEKAGKIAEDPGSMIAVDAPSDFLHEKVKSKKEIYFTNFNSPHQTVIGGGTQEIQQLKAELEEAKHWSTILPVSMVFHSPIMKPVLGEFRDFLKTIDMQSPQLPVISNTTRLPFPNDAADIIEIIVSHLESPVHWQDNVTSLWNDYGIRSFVEIGPRNTLSNLILDILPEAHCINSCYPRKEKASLVQAVGSLYSTGHIHPPSVSDLTAIETTGPTAFSSPGTGPENTIQRIIREEIYSYAQPVFDKYLKPVIIKAIQQQADPDFSEEKLPDFLPEGFKPEITGPIKTDNLDIPDTENNVVLEQIIRIIMDATGYERHEIRPEMDIRQDLAIKSSRIPVIIDAAERTFNVSTTLEDFMAVRTVEELAESVSKLMKTRDHSRPIEAVPIDTSMVSSDVDDDSQASSSHLAINRFVYRKKELTLSKSVLLQIDKNSRILLLSLTQENHVNSIRDYFKTTHNSQVIPLTIGKNQEQSGFINLFDPDETKRTLSQISDEGPLTGVILISDDQAEEQLSLSEINTLITGFFLLFQQFIKSEKRSFSTHIRINNSVQSESLLGQSILGLFLTAITEYKTLCLRSLTILDNSDPTSLMPILFNISNPIIELLSKGKKLFTQKLTIQAAPMGQQPKLTLNKESVIVISGGGRGITSYLARSIAPFGCRLILLGRSTLDETTDSNDELDASQTDLEIRKTLTKLGELGAKAHYFSCDVANQSQVFDVIEKVSAQYGRIDGIIHGAGIFKDSYIPLITGEMFKEVMDVKLLGAIHLLEACQDKGLRFIVASSSIAAVAGNTGQTNYCMANRAMSSYCRLFMKQHPSVTTKVFWLPPIEGAGMADNPELKDIIKQNLGSDIFLGVSEVAEIMLRELLMGSTEECWLVPIRDIPKTITILSDPVSSDTHWFDQDGLPMIDSVELLDLQNRSIQSRRAISSERDLWLADHKPSKSLKYPIISAIMVIETFLEASHILYPHLQINGLKKVRFLNMIECPPGEQKQIHIVGQGEQAGKGLLICKMEFKYAKDSIVEESEQQIRTYYSGQVVLSPSPPALGRKDIGNMMKTVLFSQSDIVALYEKHCGLRNRYQVLDSIGEFSSDGIQGTMIYPAVDDFGPALPSTFQYPHYLLEALMQSTLFYASIRDDEKQLTMETADVKRTMVPTEIGNISFSRNCNSGEKLFLDARLRFEDESGITWNVTGIDDKGEIIMKVESLHMGWIG